MSRYYARVYLYLEAHPEDADVRVDAVVREGTARHPGVSYRVVTVKRERPLPPSRLPRRNVS